MAAATATTAAVEFLDQLLSVGCILVLDTTTNIAIRTGGASAAAAAAAAAVAAAAAAAAAAAQQRWPRSCAWSCY